MFQIHPAPPASLVSARLSIRGKALTIAIQVSDPPFSIFAKDAN
jgi:hypothetical protein